MPAQPIRRHVLDVPRNRSGLRIVGSGLPETMAVGSRSSARLGPRFDSRIPAGPSSVTITPALLPVECR